MSASGPQNIAKLVVGIAVLIFFFGVGVAHIIFPERFLKRSGLRRGGEMLTDFNRFGFRIVGLALAVFSAVVLYQLVNDLIGH